MKGNGGKGSNRPFYEPKLAKLSLMNSKPARPQAGIQSVEVAFVQLDVLAHAVVPLMPKDLAGLVTRLSAELGHTH